MLNVLIGKRVDVRVIDYTCAVRDKQPNQGSYVGTLTEVSGHMIRIDNGYYQSDGYMQAGFGTKMLNTMASTFISISSTNK